MLNLSPQMLSHGSITQSEEYVFYVASLLANVRSSTDKLLFLICPRQVALPGVLMSLKLL